MRKSTLKIVIFSTLACLSYCDMAGQLQVRQDPYKNARVITLKVSYLSDDEVPFFGSNPRKVDLTYYREKKTEGNSTVSLKIVLECEATNDLKPEAFVRVDNQAYAVTITNAARSTDVRSCTEPIVHKKGVHFHQTPCTRYWCTGNVVLPTDVWTQMLKGQQINYRLYLDDKPHNFPIGPEKHQRLKEFAAM